MNELLSNSNCFSLVDVNVGYFLFFLYSLSGCPLVSPSEKKVLMRQEAETKLMAQANAQDAGFKTVKIRSGRGMLCIACACVNHGRLGGHFTLGCSFLKRMFHVRRTPLPASGRSPSCHARVPVFYNALPQYLKNELVRIEKRALLIILPRTIILALLWE